MRTTNWRSGQYNALCKICTSCGIEQPIEEFYKIKGGKYGVVAKCKPCYLAANADSRKRLGSTWKVYKYPVEKQRVCTNTWRKNNLAYDAMRQRERTALKLRAFPLWANRENIKEIYKHCPKGFHVDHEIPLKGKNVSGLHVEFNLQYLPALENI